MNATEETPTVTAEKNWTTYVGDSVEAGWYIAEVNGLDVGGGEKHFAFDLGLEDRSPFLDQLKEGMTPRITGIATAILFPRRDDPTTLDLNGADHLVGRRVRVRLGGFCWDDSSERFIEEIQLLGEKPSNEQARVVDVANAIAKSIVEQAVERFLELRNQLDQVPDDQKADLLVRSDDIDTLFGILQPLHAKL